MKATAVKNTEPNRATNQPFFQRKKDSSFFEPQQFFEINPVQTQLTIGQPGDRFELEADAMADQVVQRLQGADAAKQNSDKLLQRSNQPEEDVQKKESIEKNDSLKSESPGTQMVLSKAPVNHLKTDIQKQAAGVEEEIPSKEDEEQDEPPTGQLKVLQAGTGDEDNPVQRSCRECEEGEDEIMFKLDPVVQRSPGSRDESSLRKRIVDIAHRELGKVEAHKTDGSGRRLGYDRLLEYFNLAAPGEWPEEVIKFNRQGFPSWCGIFSVYTIKTAGIDLGNWQMGKGVSAFNSLKVTDNPKPGDIGYIDQPKQHHFIVTEVNGDTIKSIDGNSGWFSEVIEKTRPRSMFTGNPKNGFFTPFTGSEKYLQRKEDEPSAPEIKPDIAGQLSGSKGRGASLGEAVGSKMEAAFSADFSNVRIHTDQQAVEMSRSLQAQAFTHGSDIYFNKGKYDTGSAEGKHLLAHELTHTIQQGASVQRKPEISHTAEQVQRLPDFVASEINDYARHIPGWNLFCVIIGFNPLLMTAVERSPSNLLEGLFGLVPGGTYIFDRLQEYEIVQQAYQWVLGKLSDLQLTRTGIELMLEQVYEEMDFVRLDPVEYNTRVLVRKFRNLYDRVSSFATQIADKILGMIKEALMNTLKTLASAIPGYDLFVKILGHDPLTDTEVEATTAEIIEDFLVLIGATQELEKMKELGTIEETAAWIDEQLALLNFNLEEVKRLFTEAWEAFSLADLADPIGAVRRTVAIFTPLALRVFNFAWNVSAKVFEFIKQALLNYLRSFANEVPGYHLLTVMLGRDPFTEEVVHRTAENIIRGFMGLIPGGEAQFQQMKESGAIARIAAWIEGEIAALGMTWEYIKGMFLEIWNSFTIADLMAPIPAFQRILDRFGEPLGRILRFLVRVVMKIIEIILEIMHFPLDIIRQIIANAQQAFQDIKRDPIGFLKNLLRAVKEGFSMFFSNIATHLLNGVTGWLFGQLEDAGITPPPDLSFKSILGLVLQILGITVDRIMEKVANRIGPEKMERIRSMWERLTGIWSFVKDVIERGPVAIWEKIQEKLSDLWNTVLDSIKNWIMTKVIEKVTVKLLSMLDPTGIMAVVNSFIATYNAIESFIQYLREMLEIVNSFVAGVAEIARGSITRAATFLEGALADGLPIAIGFLANQVGLGSIGEKIGEMIQKVREMVDGALDWLVDKAVSAGEGVMNSLGFGGGAGSSEEELSTLPPIDIDVDIPIGNETHEVKNVGETDRLVIFSSPTLLNEHPSQDVREAYATYLSEIAKAESMTAKTEAANTNLKKITKSIHEFGDPEKPGASAPGIGTVDLHKSQQNRMRKSGIKVWFTESEHVIPRAFINAAFRALAQAGVPAGSADYNNMHTILIYKGAANIKTNAPFGDQSTINDFKSTINELVQEVFGVAQKEPAAARSEMASSIFRLLEAFATDAKTRTNFAIINENNDNGAARGPSGSPEPPTPGDSQVTAAFNSQKQDAQQQLQNRIDQFLESRETQKEPVGEVQMQSEEVEAKKIDLGQQTIQEQTEEEEEVQLQADEEEEVQMQASEEEKIATRLNTGNKKARQVSASLSQQISDGRGRGQPMAGDIRLKMQAAFGADFDKVNIHTDQEAVQMNRELGAQAFTSGKDIYFNQGKYQPGSSSGQHLLAHELTHTIQQRAVQRKVSLQEMRSESEQEAKTFTRPEVFWTVENSYSKQPARALFSTEVTTAEQLTHTMYVTPEPMIEPFSALNGVTPEQEIMPYTRIKIPSDNRKATPWAQNGFWNSMYFNGQARNPFTILESMGLSSRGGFAAERQRIEEWLKLDLPMMVFYIQMGLEREFIALLRKYANESFTEYPDRYPYGGQYIDKILFYLSGKTKKIRKLGVTQTTSYYDIIFNHFTHADEVKTIRDVYSRLYRGDDGFREVSYGVVFLEEAFEKALKVAGVPRKDIMSFLNKAGDAISEIIADPGRFLDNLIGAFRQGFNQFLAKVGEYLTTGLLDWVLRKVGLDNVEIPKDFSHRSLLTMVLQTLKITPADLEALVAEVIGQENVDRIRKVWAVVKTFIGKGISGLVDQLVDYVGNLKQQLIANLKNWVVTRLVQRAVAEVVKLFIPGGNLVAIVKKIYNLIQFVRQRLQEITELFRSIGDSVLSIVKGNIATAAEKIHSVLKSGLYLAIELLGRLVNIKFIDGIRSAIIGLGERIRGAIKKFIEKIAIGGKAAIGKVKHWLGKREKFVTKAGVKHTLYVQERKGVYGLIIETSPMNINRFLTQKYDEVKTNENLEASQKKELTRKISHTRNLVQGLQALMNNPEQTDNPRIPNMIVEVTDNLKEIDTTATGTNILIPTAQFTPGFSSGVKAISFSARYIFKGTNETPPNHEPGSKPNKRALPDVWQVLREMGLNYRWVKFHILNENLGGKGVDSNLIPTPTYLNNEYKDEFENELKNYYRSGVPVWLNANITYDTANFAGYFPSWYSATGGGMKFENDQWVEDQAKQKRFSKQIDTPTPQSFNINSVIRDPGEATLIRNLTSVTQGIINILATHAPVGGYTNFGQMERAIETEVYGELDREISSFTEEEIAGLSQPTQEQVTRADRLKGLLRSAHFTF